MQQRFLLSRITLVELLSKNVRIPHPNLLSGNGLHAQEKNMRKKEEDKRGRGGALISPRRRCPKEEREERRPAEEMRRSHPSKNKATPLLFRVGRSVAVGRSGGDS